jgi:hypothetical protein
MTLEDLMSAPSTRGRICVGHQEFFIEFKGVFVVSDCFDQTIAFESLTETRMFIEALLYEPNPQEMFNCVAPKARGALQFVKLPSRD